MIPFSIELVLDIKNSLELDDEARQALIDRLVEEAGNSGYAVDHVDVWE